MSLRSTSVARFEALPNPRGGHVPLARTGLSQALRAFETGGDVATPLRQAGHALREAGWLAAARCVDTLLFASPIALAGGADDLRARWGPALSDLAAALDRHNLRELSCSPSLYARQHALYELLAAHTPGIALAYEDIALLGRPIAPASLPVRPAHELAQLRARYEAALLPALKSRLAGGSRAAQALASAAYDELDACLAELASADPYDFWRLARASVRALRRGAATWGDAEMRRFYARCNLLLADHAHGLSRAPQSLVRATLALLWRDYALFGAAAEDTDDVELLHDYGLSVEWHVAGTQASEALWEAGAAQADAMAARIGPTRELGALAVNANAYEDFLQTADASMATLTDHAHAPTTPPDREAGRALLAADAAYRLGAAAWALGLGHIGLLADALGLAWRRAAHAAAARPTAPDAAAIDQASEVLRAMLHKIAAGVGQPDSAGAVRALGASIAGLVPARPGGDEAERHLAR